MGFGSEAGFGSIWSEVLASGWAKALLGEVSGFMRGLDSLEIGAIDPALGFLGLSGFIQTFCRKLWLILGTWLWFALHSRWGIVRLYYGRECGMLTPVFYCCKLKSFGECETWLGLVSR